MKSHSLHTQIAIAALAVGVTFASVPAFAQSTNGPAAQNYGAGSNAQTGGVNYQSAAAQKPLYNAAPRNSTSRCSPPTHRPGRQVRAGPIMARAQTLRPANNQPSRLTRAADARDGCKLRAPAAAGAFFLRRQAVAASRIDRLRQIPGSVLAATALVCGAKRQAVAGLGLPHAITLLCCVFSQDFVITSLLETEINPANNGATPAAGSLTARATAARAFWRRGT